MTETNNGESDFTPEPVDVVIEADEDVVVGFYWHPQVAQVCSSTSGDAPDPRR